MMKYTITAKHCHWSLILVASISFQKKIIETPIVKHPTATQGLSLSPVAECKQEAENPNLADYGLAFNSYVQKAKGWNLWSKGPKTYLFYCLNNYNMKILQLEHEDLTSDQI